jgi:hypothetical protein
VQKTAVSFQLSALSFVCLVQDDGEFRPPGPGRPIDLRPVRDDLEVHVFAIRENVKMCGLAIFRFVHLQVSVLEQNSTGRCMDFAFRAPES